MEGVAGTGEMSAEAIEARGTSWKHAIAAAAIMGLPMGVLSSSLLPLAAGALLWWVVAEDGGGGAVSASIQQRLPEYAHRIANRHGGGRGGGVYCDGLQRGGCFCFSAMCFTWARRLTIR